MNDLPNCDTCMRRMKLSVYTLNQSDILMSALAEENVHYVCMAFSDEGIAEIGTFSGLGCEMYFPKSKTFGRSKNDIYLTDGIRIS